MRVSLMHVAFVTRELHPDLFGHPLISLFADGLTTGINVLRVTLSAVLVRFYRSDIIKK
jgi:hypothetical protein